MDSSLKLIVLDNAKELGDKVFTHLQKTRKEEEDYLVPITRSRFANGEGKVRIDKSVRDKDLYVIADIGNYNLTYNYYGMEHHISPDEHFQDIIRLIGATSGHATKINLIMPLLYQSRQHKRKGRESLDCALALQQLEKLGVDNIISFDVHDPNVANAVPNLPFYNFYPTNTIIDEIIKNESLSNILVISPDIGAMERARYYAEMLNCDAGLFYKRRDLSKVINGKNPIVEHIYLGSDVKDKDILVVDDLISSGSSMIETAKELKEKGAKRVFLVCTFALFVEGPDIFEKEYKNNIFERLYATNLSYVPNNIKERNWYYEVDCSILIANIIDKMHKKESLEKILHNKEDKIKLVSDISVG